MLLMLSVNDFSAQGLEVGSAVLAERADEVVGQDLALVDVAADLADPALLEVGLGLGLDVGLVVVVGHGLLGGQDPGLGNGADEHAVSVQVHVLLHLEAHKGVDVLVQEDDAVVGAEVFALGELVHVPAGLEAKVLEGGEGDLHGQAVDVHHAGLLRQLVGVVGLVDAHGDAVRRVRHLGHGVDDAAVVLAAVPGGDDVEAVADLEQGGEVGLVGGLVVLGQIVHAELVSQLLDLGLALLAEAALEVHGGVGEAQILAALQHPLHDFGGHGSPGAVLDEGHSALLEVPLGQVLDEVPHEGEDPGVVGGGRQNDAPILEGLLYALRHILPGQVHELDLGAALFLELLGKELGGGLGVAVDGGIGDHHALALHAVARPGVVKVQIIAQVFREHGAVGGADDLNIQRGSLFQQGLDLGAVFPHDAEVIAPGFAGPALRVLHVQGAEFAEAVGGEEDLVLGVVGHDDLGPVDHGGLDEVQHVLAQLQGVALLDLNAAFRKVGAEEVLHHGEGLGRTDEGGVGVGVHKDLDVGAVVGLHVLDHQVVGLAAAELGGQVGEPLPGEVLVHGVHDGDFPVQDQVGVVGHTQRHLVLALEEVDLVVVDANVADVPCNCHC